MTCLFCNTKWRISGVSDWDIGSKPRLWWTRNFPFNMEQLLNVCLSFPINLESQFCNCNTFFLRKFSVRVRRRNWFDHVCKYWLECQSCSCYTYGPESKCQQLCLLCHLTDPHADTSLLKPHWFVLKFPFLQHFDLISHKSQRPPVVL